MAREELLRNVAFLRSLDPHDIDALSRQLDEVRLKPGDVILHEGEAESTSLFIIVEGDIEITHGHGRGLVELALLHPGQYFGEMSLLDGAPRSATATARTAAVLLRLERQDFLAYLKKDPDAAVLLLAELGGRLRHTNELVAQTTEDIQKMGGMEALDAPYTQVSFWSMVKKRGGWLAILFLGEMLTATAMSHYEDEISKAVVLALFVPLIISSGGNSGSQGSSLIIRALALKELKLRDWWRVFGREILTGVVLGAMLGAIGFVRIALWQRMGWANYGAHYMRVCVTVWLSLIGVVGFGSLSGSMLPFILRSFGFDPATSSAPFVATLVDVTGLIIYFTVAAIILGGIAA